MLVRSRKSVLHSHEKVSSHEQNLSHRTYHGTKCDITLNKNFDKHSNVCDGRRSYDYVTNKILTKEEATRYIQNN